MFLEGKIPFHEKSQNNKIQESSVLSWLYLICWLTQPKALVAGDCLNIKPVWKCSAMLCGQARGEDGNGGDYIVFGLVLFLWEHVPAWSVVLFFRAQRLNQNLVRYHNISHALSHFFKSMEYLSWVSVFSKSETKTHRFSSPAFTQSLTLRPQAPAGMVSSHSSSSRAFFFDNPRRYDSDDDLPRLGSSREGR